MAIPSFISELRRHIGNAPLWLTGVSAVVLRNQHVLLVRSADTGEWGHVSGIVEPGENPADCAAREVLEESGIRAVAKRLAWVHVTKQVTHLNGDQAQYLNLVFAMNWVAGEPFPADDEIISAGWFDLQRLPNIPADRLRELEVVCNEKRSTTTIFDTSE
ncbi:NUDIX domain-containing protein [Mycobacterium sp. ITM-2016-00316]|uniref:NUDIX hydrolase n=1 Tax=Mycobacterium sp. ITM-2016-00316 TaxID=2099695 RepID=UPI000CF8A6B1|nr:NUDIX domain-containing protein [Mycobacterium sp. ITM-2016-00316]WNG84194.1 NUDIX domain-containing protein [Mycobacterium sp. ITM-2016-00316]